MTVIFRLWYLVNKREKHDCSSRRKFHTLNYSSIASTGHRFAASVQQPAFPQLSASCLTSAYPASLFSLNISGQVCEHRPHAIQSFLSTCGKATLFLRLVLVYPHYWVC